MSIVSLPVLHVTPGPIRYVWLLLATALTVFAVALAAQVPSESASHVPGRVPAPSPVMAPAPPVVATHP